MNSSRRRPILFGGLALLALVVFMGLWTRGPSIGEVKTSGAGERQQVSREGPRAAASGVFAMSPREAVPRTPGSPQRADPPRPQAPALPFSFLGKVRESGGTSIILYRAGRTFTVRGPGRLDDNYEVEAVQETFLVLRYLPLGEQQVLELSAPLQAAAQYGSAADTPQD